MKVIAGSLAALCAIGVLPASAELRERDLAANGDRLITRDTASALDWLDLTGAAYCWSLQSVWNYWYCRTGSLDEWFSDGWRRATTEEVCGLFGEHLFDEPGRCSGATDSARLAYLMGLLGNTYSDNAGSGIRSKARFDDDTGGSLLGYAELYFSNTGPAPYGRVFLALDYMTSDPIAGITDFLVRPSPGCEDGLDNDGDGVADFPQDPGCQSTEQAIEGPECQDGADNDDDGRIDYPADPGCADPVRGIEAPQCDDKIDNDGDGAIDTADIHCVRPFGRLERAWPYSQCGLGFELTVLLPVLQFLRRRRVGIGLRHSDPGRRTPADG